MLKTKKAGKNSGMTNIALTEAQMQKLAHAGTKEAIAKLEAYLGIEKDVEKKGYAEMSLEECEFFYYQPHNEKEEKEFLLCKLINDREVNLSRMEMKIENIKTRLEKFNIEKEVHEKVLVKNKNKKKEWQYYCMDEFVLPDRNRLEELADTIEYEKAWIKAAKEIIKTQRYKNGIPARHLEHYDFGIEDDELAYDERCDCCDEYHDCCDNDFNDTSPVDVPF